MFFALGMLQQFKRNNDFKIICMRMSLAKQFAGHVRGLADQVLVLGCQRDFAQLDTFELVAAGLLQLATRWQVAPQRLAMVGDFAYDLASARAVGATAVLVNMPGNPWPELTDWRFDDCHALAAAALPAD